MRTTLLRLAGCLLLVGSLSSFSGCEKTNVSPKPGKSCEKTTTPSDTTKTTTTTTTSN